MNQLSIDPPSFKVSLNQEPTFRDDQESFDTEPSLIFQDQLQGWRCVPPSTAVHKKSRAFQTITLEHKPNTAGQRMRDIRTVTAEYNRRNSYTTATAGVSLHGKRDKYDEMLQYKLFSSVQQQKENSQTNSVRAEGSLFSLKDKIALMSRKRQRAKSLNTA